LGKKTASILLGILVFLQSACSAGFNPASNTKYDSLTQSAPVDTAYGPVTGVVSPDGLLVFLGIPYAKPPLGKFRFQQPVEPDRHGNVFQATKFGAVSCQAQDIFEHSSFFPQSEDCLNLNIWTPCADSLKRPVIVFIHGGGFICGSSADPYYDGADLAKHGNLVFVSINYRLGVLGYLYLENTPGEYPCNGNCGLLDQIMALKWVKQNIANFGGDPDNITLMGESAGAISATTIMSLPAARGLFQRVIAQSGAPTLCRSIENARNVTHEFMQVAGITDVNRLQTMPSEQIIKFQTKLIEEAGLNADRLFSPVIDGSIIAIDPEQALRSGAAKGIPLLHGTTKDEINWWILYEPGFAFIPPEAMFEKNPELKSMFGSDPAKTIGAYRQILRGKAEWDITHAMLTDRMFWIPHIRLEEAQAAHASTWMYKLSWPSPFAFGILGSYHSLDILFVFHNLDKVGPASYIPDKLASTIQDAWIAFASTGDPNHNGLPYWPAYETGERSTMIFDLESRVKDDPDGERRELYTDIPLK
jgi:para-nitrobenzyl esterase